MRIVTILTKRDASFTGQQQAGVVAYPPAVPPRPQPSQVMLSLLKNYTLNLVHCFYGALTYL